jgi:hypothetical protein
MPTHLTLTALQKNSFFQTPISISDMASSIIKDIESKLTEPIGVLMLTQG